MFGKERLGLNSNERNKRNVKIEIIRIIACMLVIWYHVREFPFKITGELSETAVFFETICTVCVVTFFLITGFFIYGRKGTIIEDWIILIKRFFINVFPPFLLTAVFCIVFHEYIISTATFSECIHNFSLIKVFNMLLDSFMSFTSDKLTGSAAHLWYVFSYFHMILVYPITRFILRKIPRVFTYLILFIITIFMIINDYYSFYGDSVYYVVFDIIKKPVYYSACGYVLYNDIIKKFIDEKCIDPKTAPLIINKKIFFISLFTYVITFVLTFKTQVLHYLTVNNGYIYTSWLSLYSLILSISFVLFVYNFNLEKVLNEKVNGIIYFISSKTLGIYLVHYLVAMKFVSIGFQNLFRKNLFTIAHHFMYYIFYSLIVFIISLIIVIVLDELKKLILGGLYGKKKRLS